MSRVSQSACDIFFDRAIALQDMQGRAYVSMRGKKYRCSDKWWSFMFLIRSETSLALRRVEAGVTPVPVAGRNRPVSGPACLQSLKLTWLLHEVCLSQSSFIQMCVCVGVCAHEIRAVIQLSCLLWSLLALWLRKKRCRCNNSRCTIQRAATSVYHFF